MESRLYGWLLVEVGYQGMLYWAANAYRYPTSANLSSLGRPEDWSPYTYSIGPLPHGRLSPGLAPGSNWILYPTESGLIDSLRARRLRDGLLDHWLYRQADASCSRSRKTDCQARLRALSTKILGASSAIGDFSRDGRAYDEARIALIDMIELPLKR
jgi:Domain of unknown function (DUF4091)